MADRPYSLDALDLTVALTAREARALAAAAEVTAALTGDTWAQPGRPLETGADKLRLALVETGQAAH
jgi:hypothetical protein